MRDRSGWYQHLTTALTPTWPQYLRDTFKPKDLAVVELGLHVLSEMLPGARALDAWPLFGGYPFAELFNADLDAAAHRRLAIARHYLWPLRRRHIWRGLLKAYLKVPLQYRGFDFDSSDAVPQRRDPSIGADRFALFGKILDAPPRFQNQRLKLASVGDHLFYVKHRTLSVSIPDGLTGHASSRFQLHGGKNGNGQPITVSHADMQAAAKEMDRAEAANPGAKRRNWQRCLADVEVAIRSQTGFEFTENWVFTIDRLFHLVGMVGAGKSTLRDLLTYHCVTKLGLKVTIVVGDVPEILSVTQVFNNLRHPAVRAAPIIGRSTRERHIHRLHRRQHTAGAASLLAHDSTSFEYLSSACPLDALRGMEGVEPLRLAQAPCTSLCLPPKEPKPSPFGEQKTPAKPKKLPRRGCPLWSQCPRHHGARELVDASIWVATSASLLHSLVPAHQIDEKIRYLEFAADRSDLIIVDEADRVQMQLDSQFAPAATLYGKGEESWLDELARHKIDQISLEERQQLSDDDVSQWVNALDTVTAAANRIYSMLNQDTALQKWVGTSYFSAQTLHANLISDWYGEEPVESESVEVVRLDRVLNAYRDKPVRRQTFEPDAKADPDRDLVNRLVELTLDLLHNPYPDTARMAHALAELTEPMPQPAGNEKVDRDRFAFTLLVAALHQQLDLMLMLWPRVEAALSLESTSNALTHRPPKDYQPVIAESPTGNVLGFQFMKPDGDNVSHSGSLRFFQCSGLGRQLLSQLPSFGSIDNQPGPHVMLMSATSWAGQSSRYHIQAPVDAILRPPAKKVELVCATAFKHEFVPVKGGGFLRFSGAPMNKRRSVLEAMLRYLAEPDRELVDSTSLLADELDAIGDDRRRRILLLTGSYKDAEHAAKFLHAIPEWHGKVTALIPDDADFDDTWISLRRGDLNTYPDHDSQLLVAPILAVERGHNIVNPDGTAAIGSVYFLTRPHPVPNDINLSIHAINDWAMRYLTDGDFARLAHNPNPENFPEWNPDAAGRFFRDKARRQWFRFITRRMAWSSLNGAEKIAFTWDQFVVIWQVIGRLVRGGVPARVKFVDAAFAPGVSGRPEDHNDPDINLLDSFRHVLAPYFSTTSAVSQHDRDLVANLYQPFYEAMCAINFRE